MSCITDEDTSSSSESSGDDIDCSDDSEEEISDEQFQAIDPDSTPTQRYLNFLAGCIGASYDRPNDVIDWDEHFEEGSLDPVQYLQWLLMPLDMGAEMQDGLTPFELFLRTSLQATGELFNNLFKTLWAPAVDVFLQRSARVRRDLLVDMYLPSEKRVVHGPEDQELMDAATTDDDDEAQIVSVKRTSAMHYTDDNRYDEWPYEGNMQQWLECSGAHYLPLIDLLGSKHLFDWQYVHDQLDWSIISEDQWWSCEEQVADASVLCQVLLFGYESEGGSKYILDEHVRTEFRRRTVHPILHDALPCITGVLIDHILLGFIN